MASRLGATRFFLGRCLGHLGSLPAGVDPGIFSRGGPGLKSSKRERVQGQIQEFFHGGVQG